MPRIARSMADGEIYHVLNGGNCKRILFHRAQLSERGT